MVRSLRGTSTSGFSLSSTSQPGTRPPLLSSSASHRPPTSGLVSSRGEVDESVVVVEEKGVGEKIDAAKLVRQLRRRVRSNSSSSEKQSPQSPHSVSTHEPGDDPSRHTVQDSASVAQGSHSFNGMIQLGTSHILGSPQAALAISSYRSSRSTRYSSVSRSQPESSDGMNPMDRPRRRGKRGKTPPSRRKVKSVDGSRMTQATTISDRTGGKINASEQ